MNETNGWERWLHVGGSLASLAALGYLLTHLPRRGERVSVAGISGRRRALSGFESISPSMLKKLLLIEREHTSDPQVRDAINLLEKDPELLRLVVGSFAGLPKKGRIPLKTAKRALKSLPRRYQKCGITPALLREGMEIEREHAYTTKGAVGATARVSADHLCEQLNYYRKLKKYVEA